jgi:putative hemolysin
LYLFLLILFLLFSAFFSGTETAFTALQRYKLENMLDNKVKGADKVAKIKSNPENFLSTVLLGNNLVNTAASALATAICVYYWGDVGVVISTILVTVVLLIFGEITPKSLGSRFSDRFVLILARPIEIVSFIFRPLVIALSWISSRFVRLFGGGSVPSSLVTEEEIRSMIRSGFEDGALEQPEAELLHNVFEFGDRPVREVITPRSEVIAIEKGSTLADFLRLYSSSPRSRFPVYEDNLDNIVGLISVKDVLKALADGGITPESSIDSLIRPAYFVPETKPISEVFHEMKEKNYRLCVVIDEYGGTAGIVTLSRLLEEIVGPVGDEMAKAERDYETINDYTYRLDGTMRIEDANEELELDLPEGDYDTVAGFILQRLGKFPRPGQQLRHNNLKIVVTKTRGFKIEEVIITKEKKDEEVVSSKS